MKRPATKHYVNVLPARLAANTAYMQLLQQLYQALSAIPRPAVIGISGAQGSGKSTLASALATLFTRQGISAAAVSLDDYYLSKAQRQQLALDIHPLLAQRGVPGTHNMQQALTDAKAVLAGKTVSLPQFDKALDEAAAPLPAQQLDMLIVEGWCVGVQPQTAEQLASPINTLETEQDSKGHWRRFVNQQLAGAYAEYWQLLKPLIWLNAPDWQAVCRWRAQQEQQLWQQRGSGMTAPQLANFMLSFQRLTAASWQQLPQIADYIVTLNSLQQPVNNA